MSIFNSEQDVIDLSDEGLGLIEPEVEESDENAPPSLEEPAEISQEQVEAEPVVEQAKPQQEENSTQIAELQKKLDAANKGMTTSFQSAAELRKENEKLISQIAETQDKLTRLASRKPATEEERAAFASRLLDDPDGVIAERVAPVIQDVEKKIEAKYAEQERKNRAAQNLFRAKNELAKDWPALSDGVNNEVIGQKLVEISLAATGGKDASLWQNAPDFFLREAAIGLWGIPEKLNQTALDEAVKKAQESALAQLREAEANKSKAAPIGGSKQPQSQNQSDDDKIRESIRSAIGSGVF